MPTESKTNQSLLFVRGAPRAFAQNLTQVFIQAQRHRNCLHDPKCSAMFYAVQCLCSCIDRSPRRPLAVSVGHSEKSFFRFLAGHGLLADK
jgi:hypothetical protein